jgi:hypothetical protein
VKKVFEMNETYYTIGEVELKTIQDIQSFVNFVSKFSDEYYLNSGRYIINAKSIMGIYSLDLSKPIRLVSTKENNDEILKEFNKQNFKKE